MYGLSCWEPRVPLRRQQLRGRIPLSRLRSWQKEPLYQQICDVQLIGFVFGLIQMALLLGCLSLVNLIISKYILGSWNPMSVLSLMQIRSRSILHALNFSSVYSYTKLNMQDSSCFGILICFSLCSTTSKYRLRKYIRMFTSSLHAHTLPHCHRVLKSRRDF